MRGPSRAGERGRPPGGLLCEAGARALRRDPGVPRLLCRRRWLPVSAKTSGRAPVISGALLPSPGHDDAPSGVPPLGDFPGGCRASAAGPLLPRAVPGGPEAGQTGASSPQVRWGPVPLAGPGRRGCSRWLLGGWGPRLPAQVCGNPPKLHSSGTSGAAGGSLRSPQLLGPPRGVWRGARGLRGSVTSRPGVSLPPCRIQAAFLQDRKWVCPAPRALSPPKTVCPPTSFLYCSGSS